MSVFDSMRNAGSSRLVFLSDDESGLRAILALDDLTLGPAMGGIRTCAYESTDAAIADAQRLASAMTLKTAIAGLPAGGAKTVVIDHPGFERAAGFRRLGRFVQDLRGLYFAAGDLGTTQQDLSIAAEVTPYINAGGPKLGKATADGVVECMKAAVETRGFSSVAGLRVAIQGCGLIGSSVARRLHSEGANLVVADLNPSTAETIARELGAEIAAPGEILAANVDVLSPCGMGGVLTSEVVPTIKAWAICGGANNQLSDPSVARALADRNIAFIPDFLASAGGVVLGAAEALPGQLDADHLIQELGTTTRSVIGASAKKGITTVEAATEMARLRIEGAP